MIFQPSVPLLAFAAAFWHASCALADPLIITPAAQLAPRATDPSFVGYISAAGGFSDGRTCDYPQTVSTSGSYAQCCPTTGSCIFYTACSSNTLVAAGGASTVPCDIDTASLCNTGIVLPTVGASSGPQFVACWQRTLGSSAFTFVQDIGSATVAPATTTSSGSGSSSHTTSGIANTSSASSRTTTPASTSRMSSTGTSAAATTSTPNAAVGVDSSVSGGLLGLVAFIAQALL